MPQKPRMRVELKRKSRKDPDVRCLSPSSNGEVHKYYRVQDVSLVVHSDGVTVAQYLLTCRMPPCL